MRSTALRKLAPAGALVSALVGGDAWAACETSAALTGDADLVAHVRALLVQHGVALDGDGCVVVRIELQRRDHAIAIVRTSAPAEERVVTEATTAATVIESWTRDDFEHSLLSDHVVAVASPMPTPAIQEESVAVANVVEPPTGLQAFTAAETSFADDGTSWAGAMLGICVNVGRVCASARARVAVVVDGPGGWESADRRTEDVLIGIDVPFLLHGNSMLFGIGAGMGSVHTGSTTSGISSGNETSGLRGDAHLGWNLKLARWVSVDVSVALDLSQVGDVEGTLSSEVTKEPHFFGRIGAGLRIGAQ
ncbi:hypothetical protein BH11MYX2_BH11MYX2_27030 [soil metagenome]